MSNALRKGFTLIELLLVIVIIVVLTGVAIPVSANYINERQLYNAATRVQQDLLLVQNYAITHSTESKFKFTFTSSSSYNYERNEAGTNVTTYTFPSSINIYEFTINGTSTILPKYFNFDNQGRLRQTGSPSTCYIDIYLQLANGAKQIKVSVSQIGRVTIEWIKQ